MNFASDNGAGVAPQILEAIVASSRVNAPAYGADDYTRRAEQALSRVFETPVSAYPRRDGNGRQCAGALRAGAPLGGGLLPRRIAHP